MENNYLNQQVGVESLSITRNILFGIVNVIERSQIPGELIDHAQAGKQYCMDMIPNLDNAITTLTKKQKEMAATEAKKTSRKAQKKTSKKAKKKTTNKKAPKKKIAKKKTNKLRSVK